MRNDVTNQALVLSQGNVKPARSGTVQIKQI